MINTQTQQLVDDDDKQENVDFKLLHFTSVESVTCLRSENSF